MTWLCGYYGYTYTFYLEFNYKCATSSYNKPTYFHKTSILNTSCDLVGTAAQVWGRTHLGGLWINGEHKTVPLSKTKKLFIDTSQHTSSLTFSSLKLLRMLQNRRISLLTTVPISFFLHLILPFLLYIEQSHAHTDLCEKSLILSREGSSIS